MTFEEDLSQVGISPEALAIIKEAFSFPDIDEFIIGAKVNSPVYGSGIITSTFPEAAIINIEFSGETHQIA